MRSTAYTPSKNIELKDACAHLYAQFSSATVALHESHANFFVLLAIAPDACANPVSMDAISVPTLCAFRESAAAREEADWDSSRASSPAPLGAAAGRGAARRRGPCRRRRRAAAREEGRASRRRPDGARSRASAWSRTRACQRTRGWHASAAARARAQAPLAARCSGTGRRGETLERSRAAERRATGAWRKRTWRCSPLPEQGMAWRRKS
eukprot:5952396-Pleurochrysis_carterae.AAC.2